MKFFWVMFSVSVTLTVIAAYFFAIYLNSEVVLTTYVMDNHGMIIDVLYHQGYFGTNSMEACLADRLQLLVTYFDQPNTMSVHYCDPIGANP